MLKMFKGETGKIHLNKYFAKSVEPSFTDEAVKLSFLFSYRVEVEQSLNLHLDSHLNAT